MKTYNKIALIAGSALVIIAILIAGIQANKVDANASVIVSIPPVYLGSTTTPPFYTHLKAGVSTTTGSSVDSYIAGTNGALDQGSVSLLLTLTATSTPPTLKWRYEFSQDGIDWYPESVALTANATTTIVVRDFAEYSWLFASSTAGSATNSRIQKLVSVPTPTRYVRPVFYLVPGSPNAALHYRYVVKTQR